MNKLFRKILIISIAVFGTGLLLIPSTFAQAKDLVVQFEQTPLFNEANFLPGNTVSRWVKATNNSSYTMPIATRAINVSDPDSLGSKLDLIIKEGANTLYAGKLSDFLTVGEVYLSDLAGGAHTQYDFKVTFDSSTDDHYQGKRVGFDIQIGFQGDLPTPTQVQTFGGGGGFGGGSYPLIIYNEKVPEVGTTSITITWETNLPATSRVVCSLTDSFKPNSSPNYGYSFSTKEDAKLVTFHSVFLDKLQPATTYFCRAISHTLVSKETVSKRIVFTTKGVAGAETFPEGTKPPISEKPAGEIVPPAEAAPEEEAPEGEVKGISEAAPEEKDKEKKPAEVSMLAAIKNAFANLGKFLTICYSCLPWWIILILALYPLTKSIAARKTDKKESKIWLGWFAVLVILAIIFYFLSYRCVAMWVFIILGLINLLVWWLIFKRREKIEAGKTISEKLKQNSILIFGLLLLLILLIIWLIKKCLYPWLIILFVIVFYIAVLLFKQQKKSKKNLTLPLNS